jgi:hypothetical protein
MPFHRIARHRVLAMGVAPSAAGDDLTACDEVLAVARQIRHGAVDVEPAWTLPHFDASLLSGGNPQEKTARLDWQPVSRRPTLTLVPTDNSVWPGMSCEMPNRVIIPRHPGDGRNPLELAGVAGEVATPARS